MSHDVSMSCGTELAIGEDTCSRSSAGESGKFAMASPPIQVFQGDLAIKIQSPAQKYHKQITHRCPKFPLVG